MKFLVDLFPVVIFFAAYHQADMYVATGAVMGACMAQTFGYRAFGGAYDKNHLLALVLVLPFGAATLAFRDPAFIKWNGTVETWLLGLLFLGSQLVGDRPAVERMLGHAFEAPRSLWVRLNLAWAAFFFVSGLANIFVAYRFDEATWVNFRLFGLTGMSIVFIVAQMVWLMRSLPPPVEAEATTDERANLGPGPG